MIHWGNVRVTPLGYVYEADDGETYTAEQIDLLVLAAILSLPAAAAPSTGARVVALEIREQGNEALYEPGSTTRRRKRRTQPHG